MRTSVLGLIGILALGVSAGPAAQVVTNDGPYKITQNARLNYAASAHIYDAALDRIYSSTRGGIYTVDGSSRKVLGQTASVRGTGSISLDAARGAALLRGEDHALTLSTPHLVVRASTAPPPGPERQDVQAAQHPFATVLSCADSQVPPEHIFNTGLGELHIPDLQPGSSIMPGKVNPVIPEVVNQIAYQVIGNDLTVTLAAEAGQRSVVGLVPLLAGVGVGGQAPLIDAVAVMLGDQLTGLAIELDQEIARRIQGDETLGEPFIELVALLR
mgnify:CR=1 FL=1